MEPEPIVELQSSNCTFICDCHPWIFIPLTQAAHMMNATSFFANIYLIMDLISYGNVVSDQKLCSHQENKRKYIKNSSENFKLTANLFSRSISGEAGRMLQNKISKDYVTWQLDWTQNNKRWLGTPYHLFFFYLKK